MMETLRRGWIVLALAALSGLAGCGEPARRWVEDVAADSAAAEDAMARGETDEAARHLEAIVNREVPSDVATEDARVVRQDAHDRLARLALDAGALDRALGHAETGLAFGEEDDVFTANLLTTRGRVHEAAGRDLEAARDYHRALRINEVLLERALGDTP